MRNDVASPEKVAAAHETMNGGDLSDLPTPMQPRQEVPSGEMNVLQDALQVSARKKTWWLRMLAFMVVAFALTAMEALSFAVMTLAFGSTLGMGGVIAATVSSLTLVAVIALVDRSRLKAKVLSPPGSWARVALRFVFSKKTFDNVYAQAIADMRDEHFEALSEGRLWKARWIVLAYYANLVLTVFAWFGTSVIQKLVGLWKIGL